MIYTASLSGQSSTVFGELFTTGSGLSHNEVTAILQDSLGFLWIGTGDGLNKYDGYYFDHFRYVPDTSSLSSNSIHCIAEGRDGVLWIGTDNGLNKLDRAKGYVWSYYLPGTGSIDTGVVMRAVIHDVFEDTAGYVWVRTDTGIERFDPDSNEFTGYDLFHESWDGDSSKISYSMVQDDMGRIWTGTRDGLQMLDPGSGRIMRYDGSEGIGPGSMDVRAVFIDFSGRIWVGAATGLFWLDSPGNTFNDVADSLPELENIEIFSLEQTNNGEIIAGTPAGVYVLDPGLKYFRYFDGFVTQELNINTRLANVYSIFEDATEILWLGTGTGLVKIDRKARKFDVVSSLNPVMEGISSYMISSIYHDDNGDLWLGTNGRGLNYIKAGTSQAIVFESSGNLNRISNDQVHAIHKDRAGNIWIGTGDGLNVREPDSQRFYRFCDREPGVPCSLFRGQHIYDIMSDSRNQIWIAASNGVHRYDPVNGTIRTFGRIINVQQNLPLQDVYCIFEDRQGWIWMGSSVGLIKYIPGSEHFDVYQAGISNQGSNINNNMVFSLNQDIKGRLWIGTASGLNMYDRGNDRIEYFPDPLELAEMRIYSIQLDNEGRILWLSSNRGVSQYDPELGTFITYGPSDGLQSNEFQRGAGYKDASGRIYFGGVSGYNSFHPDSLVLNPHIPSLSFTHYGRRRDQGGTARSYPLDQWTKLEVSRGDQIITIGFSALDFTSPERNRYMYRMVKKGQDGLWIHLGEQHYVTFQILSPGAYILSIKGSNNDLLYNEEGLDLEIVVPYSFWGKGWAFAIYFVGGIMIIYLSSQIRTRNLRKSVRRLREKEISAQEISRQREELATRHKNITDSIIYGKRIQIALLPSIENFKAILPDSFVLFKPKDIVSGDFYWINQHGNKVYVAAVDCTGHGVPGAFVSIIGFELFRKITTSEKGSNPAMILDTLNDNFTEIFSDGEQVYLNDGMDLSLCVIDRKEKSLDFSGAFNPLYLVRNETIIEVKADRFSVGADVHASMSRKLFKSHKIYLQPDDIIYMFSDGYADQFGGPEGKKFKYRRFRHLLLTIHNLPLEQQQSIMDESIEEWRGDMDQVDDILVMGIRPNLK